MDGAAGGDGRTHHHAIVADGVRHGARSAECADVLSLAMMDQKPVRLVIGA